MLTYLIYVDLLLIGPSRNELQWKSNQNTKLPINENVFEIVVWEMVAILSRERWVKTYFLLAYRN